jgi:hypothetical protein
MRILGKKPASKVCAHTGCSKAGEYLCEHCATWYCARHAGKVAGAHRADGAKQAS